MSYIPLGVLTPLTDLLYTAAVPASTALSPSLQRSITLAPSTASSTIFFVAACTMSAAILYLVISGAVDGAGPLAAGTAVSSTAALVSDMFMGGYLILLRRGWVRGMGWRAVAVRI